MKTNDLVNFLHIDPTDSSEQVKQKIEKLFERVEALEKIMNDVISTKVAGQLMYYGSRTYMQDNEKWVSQIRDKQVEEYKEKLKEVK